MIISSILLNPVTQAMSFVVARLWIDVFSAVASATLPQTKSFSSSVLHAIVLTVVVYYVLNMASQFQFNLPGSASPAATTGSALHDSGGREQQQRTNVTDTLSAGMKEMLLVGPVPEAPERSEDW